MREDIPIQPDAFHEEILQSFPPKNNSLFDDNMRQEIYEKVDRAMVPTIVTSESVKIQIRRLFRNRQTGMDGCTVEHLLSVFNGGKGHEQLKRSLLEEYALFLQKFFTADLYEHELQLFHQVKLAGILKNEDQCRVIMLFSFRSKLALFSADASKAYYNLNWDLFKKRLEEKAPGAFNLLLGESKGSTDAFFYDMLEGVRCVSQVEGGVQRQPRRTRNGLWI